MSNDDRWNFNGKTLTMFNIAAMFVSIGLYIGVVRAHVVDGTIHPTHKERAAEIEHVVAPVRGVLVAHATEAGHPGVTVHRLNMLEAQADRHEDRYDGIMAELAEVKALLRKLDR